MEKIKNLFQLQDKIILVTGGYGHLGKAISEGFLGVGAKVFVLGKSDKKFKANFDNTPNVFFQKFDISDTSSIQEGFIEIHEKTQRIDVLINNAFYSKGQNPEKMSDKDWAYGIDGTLNSVYRCIRGVLPFMKEKGGKIINVSSMYGIVSPSFDIYKNNSFLNPPHYGVAKAGVLQMTRYYACYLGKYNIQVNAITPGAFPSKKVQRSREFINELKVKNPLQKIGKPKDLQGAFILLSSKASDFITGQNIIVDGGWTAW